jgi:hypothetical protein
MQDAFERGAIVISSANSNGRDADIRRGNIPWNSLIGRHNLPPRDYAARQESPSDKREKGRTCAHAGAAASRLARSMLKEELEVRRSARRKSFRITIRCNRITI